MAHGSSYLHPPGTLCTMARPTIGPNPKLGNTRRVIKPWAQPRSLLGTISITRRGYDTWQAAAIPVKTADPIRVPTFWETAPIIAPMTPKT
jgi:hypothetical protein